MAHVIPHRGVRPEIAPDAFVAPNAAVIGDVAVGPRASVWYGCTVRGDVNYVRIGEGTNVQDNTVIHVDHARFPTVIGKWALIGHACVIHACTLEDESFVGMSSTVMDDVVVETHAMLAAGSLVTPGCRVPAGQLWAGRPAKYMRDLTDEEIADIRVASERYADLAGRHKAEIHAMGDGA